MEFVLDIYIYCAVLQDGWWIVDQYNVRNDSLERL